MLDTIIWAVIWLCCAGTVAVGIGLAVIRVRECQIPREVTAAELARLTADAGWWRK